MSENHVTVKRKLLQMSAEILIVVNHNIFIIIISAPCECNNLRR